MDVFLRCIHPSGATVCSPSPCAVYVNPWKHLTLKHVKKVLKKKDKSSWVLHFVYGTDTASAPCTLAWVGFVGLCAGPSAFCPVAAMHSFSAHSMHCGSSQHDTVPVCSCGLGACGADLPAGGCGCT